MQIVDLNVGYAENSAVPRLILSSKDSFGTVEEIYLSLTKYFLEEFQNRSKAFIFKKCCKKNNKDKDFIYCPKCGNRLEDYSFSKRQFADWITWAYYTDCDKWPIHESEHDWYPFSRTCELLKYPDKWITLDIYPEQKMAIIAEKIINNKNVSSEEIKNILDNFWKEHYGSF